MYSLCCEFLERTYRLEIHTEIITDGMMKNLGFASKLLWKGEDIGGDINKTGLAFEKF